MRRVYDGVGGAVATVLQLRPGEAALFVLIFAHAFAGGVPQAFTSAAGNALFLEQYGAAALPWAYLAAAAVVPLATWCMLGLQRRVAFATFLTVAVATTAVIDAGFWAATRLLPDGTASVGLPVWIELQYALIALALWALAGRLMDIQQAKRLFAPIAAGAILSMALVGMLTPFIVARLGTANLLLLSALASSASLVVLRYIVRRQRPRLEAPPDRGDREQRAAASDTGTRAYLRGVYGLAACSLAAYYLVERVFLDRATAALPDSDALAGFLGVLFGVSAFVSLLFQTFATARVLARLGLAVGLLALPVLILAQSAAAAAVGWTLGAGPLLFGIVMATRGADRVVRESLEGPTGQILYQPLPAAARVRAQGTAESIVGPLAGGAASLGVIALQTVPGIDAPDLAAVTVLVSVVWCVLAYRQRTAYRAMLERAVAEHRIGAGDLRYDDPTTRAVLLRAARAPAPTQALWAIDALLRVAPAAASAALTAGLAHPRPEVRRAALLRVGQRPAADVVSRIEALADADADATVRAAALRTLASLGGARVDARLRACAIDANPSVRAEAVAALLQSPEADDVALARRQIAALAESPDLDARVLAARVLGQAGGAETSPLLARLMGDADAQVRRAAVAACARAGTEPRRELVVGALGVRGEGGTAAGALAAAGDAVVPLLAEIGANATADNAIRVRALRVLGRIGSAPAAGALRERLSEGDPDVLDAALAGLCACGWRAEGVEAASLRARLADDAAAVAWLRAAAADLAGAAGGVVAAALACELRRRRQRALHVLGLLIGPEHLRGIRLRDENGEARCPALALELLDTILPPDVHDHAFAVLDGQPEGDAIGAPARLAEVLAQPRLMSAWTRACALWAIGLTGDEQARASVAALAADRDPCVRETAHWALARLDARKGDGGMLTIEKVLILKSAIMFGETSDDVLADVASILRVDDVPAGADVVVKGELGEALYIVEHGALAVRDGDRVFARLGPHDVFGELAVLDPEPRSASVTALEPSRVLRLDGVDLYDLMADRIDIARGIIKVLCQHLRETWRRRATAETGADRNRSR